LFAGHFNHDSLAFIPRRRLHVFTFLRQPRRRLLSLYNFWRAHEPDAPRFHDAMQLANDLDVESFYRSPVIASRPDTWNHMSWCIMGNRQWREWRLLLEAKRGRDRAEVVEGMRPSIRARLRELRFIGLQEDFAHSCRSLFTVLGRPCPEQRADHSVEQLAAILPFIKKVRQPAMTAGVSQAMEPLVEVDSILYEEAQALYSRAFPHWRPLVTAPTGA
jgi:hypothetical protein